MKRFDKEMLIWRVKDYFWWLRIYHRRLIWTWVLVNMLIGIPTILVMAYIEKYRRFHQHEEQPLSEQERYKLEKCNSFVYTIMKENVVLTGRIDQIREQEQELCEKRIEKIMSSDPSYLEGR